MKVLKLLPVLVLLSSGTAYGHGIDIAATAEGDTVYGRVTYAADEPAVGVQVAVLTLDGLPEGVTETDPDGRFTFRPGHSFPLRYVVQTLDGHRAQTEIALAPPAEAVAEQAEKGEQDSTRALERIATMDQRIRARDVFAGIGYIVGLMGLVAWWKSRSSRRSS